VRAWICILAVACTGGSASVETGSEGASAEELGDDAADKSDDKKGSSGGYVGRPRFEMPPQQPPEPVDAVLAPLPEGESAWMLEDERRLLIGADGATLGEQELPLDRTTGGARLGSVRVRAVPGCAVAVYEDGVWIEGRRTQPPCTDDELLAEPGEHVTWDLPGGDRYSLLPQGRVWRRGPKRAFKRPVGTWEAGEQGRVVTFDKSVYDLVSLDPCHTVFALRDPGNAYRATRSFPACDPRQATYGGFAWTLWRADNGDQLDVREPGRLIWDRLQQRTKVEGTWAGAGPALTIQLDGAPTRLAVDGCTATRAAEDGKTQEFRRIYPECTRTP